MGRNRANDAGVWGAMVGAGLAGAGSLAVNAYHARNPLPFARVPPRVPHPHRAGVGIHGNIAAPAA